MEAKFKKIETVEEYRQLLAHFNNYHFSQSALWFKTKLENDGKIFACAWLRDNQPLLLTILTPQRILRGKQFYTASFGPLINLTLNPTVEELTLFLETIGEILATTHAVFIQFNPFSFDSHQNQQINELFKSALSKPGSLLKPAKKIHRISDGTLTFDTSTNPEETMLPKFREDTRYNLKRAQRENTLEITVSSNADKPDTGSLADFEAFWKLYLTSQEQKQFSDDRKTLYQSMVAKGDALCFLAKQKNNNKPVAGLYIVRFSEQEQNTAITFLSATTDEGNKLRAPTLLRWELFKWAYANGFKKVDFFSINRDLKGYSYFKTGFGGEQVWFGPAYDLVVNKFWYSIYSLWQH
jgi:lipid II:glycine glycyltransferase (peptidoglycan interpeptide bridge formation enzyme)